MSGTEKNIYAGGNTARGFYHFYDSLLTEMDRISILSNSPRSLTASLIKELGSLALYEGHDVEWIHCASHNEYMDGILIRDLKLGILDHAGLRKVDLTELGPKLEIVNFDMLPTEEGYIIQRELLLNREAEFSQKAYDTFDKALKIHDEWEYYYINHMKFDEANVVTQELTDLFFGTASKPKTSLVRHLFFGAATPSGAIDYIQDLTKSISNRYFIKGRPGSGKSTMLKKFAAAAEQKGFDVDVFHCGFDPNSLDMVLLPELSIAIFDSTAPHEYFPSRETDEIVDMYERTIEAGTDEKYADELSEIIRRYSSAMKEATSYLLDAQNILNELDQLEMNSVSEERWDAVMKVTIEIAKKLFLVKTM